MKINHLLVCLDLSAYDKSCIKQSILISSELKSIGKVTFFHNIRYDFIDKLIHFDEEKMQLLKIKIEEDIESKINHIRETLNATVEVRVSSLPNTIEALYSRLQEAGTLAIMALKQKSDGKAILPVKFLQLNVSSPLLLIPKNCNQTFNKMVIASQKETLKKYDKLIPIIETFNNNLTWLKIVKIPKTYFPYLNTDLIDYNLSKPNIQNDSFGDFTIDAAVVKAPNVSSAILNFVNENCYDLLVMAKNENDSSDQKSLKPLGSNLQKVLQVNEGVAMLVV